MTRTASCWMLAVLVMLSFDACAKSAPPEPARASWAAGTVLVLNGVPITADEVDRTGGDFALIEPTDSLTQLRRLALTNVIFPRIAAATVHAEECAKMRAQAEEYHAALVAGTLPSGPMAGPMEVEHKGGLLDIGMEIWNFALHSEDDRWSPVLETVGAFQIARVKKRSPGPTPGLSRFIVGVFDFAFIEESPTRHKTIDEAIDHSRLVFVDESWREIVPTAWIYRMRGETP